MHAQARALTYMRDLANHVEGELTLESVILHKPLKQMELPL
jgi:hypothetical protein